MKTLFTCDQCTYSSPKWLGKCPQCENWNTFQENTPETKQKSQKRTAKPAQPLTLSRVPTALQRIKIDNHEIDRVLGGGIVPGNMILLSGEPGIGKSTLTLQLCHYLTNQTKKVLYISGEESIQQIAIRAQRLKINTEHLQLLNETDFDTIQATIEQEKPDLAIIDSIQVVGSTNHTGMPGSINQVRSCTEALMEYAKRTQTPIILIGHVTKDGNLAGPRILEHLVDTVLFLEGERYHELRLLRNLKHRFGPTNEVGIFEMTENGLIEVKNPSSAFLQEKQESSIGSCLSCTLEGTRPILVEIQALTNRTPFGYPRRNATGIDLNRVELLIAVLQKYSSINLSDQDVYVNVVGGINIKDPAVDLAICLAIFSSHKKIALPRDMIATGEVGLTGEIIKATGFEKRIKEIKKLGFSNILPAKGETNSISELGHWIG